MPINDIAAQAGRQAALHCLLQGGNIFKFNMILDFLHNNAVYPFAGPALSKINLKVHESSAYLHPKNL
ncbi:MAG: hypothetical protein WB445_13910 [Acinetobacter sp.]